MTFKNALKLCKKVGTAHASGEALAAMYANLVNVQHGGDAEKYYNYLIKNGLDDDKKIIDLARELLRDRAKSWDILMLYS